MIGTGIGLGLAGYRLNPPGVLPVLDLRFATDKSLTAFVGPTPSFSRASSGTYFDANGVLQSAGVNAARFNHVYNDTSWVSRGLLVEEQRTNLILQSSSLSTSPWSNTDYTVTSATSPDGTSNAQKLVAPASNASRRMEQSVTGTAASYSLSFYAKSAGWNFVQICYGWNSDYVNFDLANGVISNSSGSTVGSIQNIGNGWYRCIGTFTAGASTQGIRIIPMATSIASRFPNTTGDGVNGIIVFGVQFELGAFPTSYIGTTNSSVVRSADVCQITGSDFSGFWNGTEGTLAAEWDATRNSTGQFTVYWVRDSADNNTVLHTGRDALSPPGVRFEAISGGSSSAQLINAGFPDPGIQVKTAGCYKANDFAYSYNGAAALTDTSGAVPVNPTQIRIGYDPYGTWLNGHIARLRYYRTRLENGTLRVLST